MILLILGAEGTGHHAITQALAPSLLQLGWLTRGALADGRGTRSFPLLDEIVALTARRHRYMDSQLARLQHPKSVMSSLRRAKKDSAMSALQKERLLWEQLARLSEQDERNMMIDVSVPFNAGRNRSSLNFLDYFSLFESLSNLADVRCLVLWRDPRDVSQSLYRRGIEPTVLAAAESTQMAMVTVAYFSSFVAERNRKLVDYDKLCSHPAEVLTSIAAWLSIELLASSEMSITPSQLPRSIDPTITTFWSPGRIGHLVRMYSSLELAP